MMGSEGRASKDNRPSWSVLLLGGAANVGKTTAARDLAERCGASVLPVDAIWYALKPESTEGGRRVSVLKGQEGAPVNLG